MRFPEAANPEISYFLKNCDNLAFEFQDKNFKSTIKKCQDENDSGKEIIVSVNRFREEMK